MSSFISSYSLFKKIAFKIDAEKAHEYSIQLASQFPRFAKTLAKPFDSLKYRLKSSHLETHFPVGLAAGLDKNAECIDFFSYLQFGFIEVGTVTPLPQPGNDRPRLFRIPEEESLRNRMGFNNQGMDQVFDNISRAKSKLPLGINLGKNKLTSEDKAVEDYLTLFHKFKKIANYLVINISSPNTMGLRDLQNEQFLTTLMSEIRKTPHRPAIFLKLAPDLQDSELRSLTELAMKLEFQGLIATNTCLRPDLGPGGVSGKLLSLRGAQARRACLQVIPEGANFDFIGVGGISCFDDLWEFWKDGGRMAQVYTAFIYQGPQLLVDIKEGIDRKLEKHQVNNLSTLLENIQDL